MLQNSKPLQEGKRLTHVLETTFKDVAGSARFVAWDLKDKGGPKPTKIPINPQTGQPASVIDNQSWVNGWQALAAFINKGHSGIGLVLNGDGIAGVDIDNCVNEKGIIEPYAIEIISALNSYTEFSPSGKGIRIFFRASQGLPDGRRKNGKIEVYEKERFLTITGNRLDAWPNTIEERSDAIREVHKRFLQPSVSQNGMNGSNLSDVLTFEKLSADKPRHDELLKRIGILKKSGATKEFALQVAAAIARNHNEPGKRLIDESEVAKEVDWIYKSEGSIPIIFPIDLVVSANELRAQELPEREWIIQDVQPCKSASMIFGPKGIGKTRILLSKAISVASGSNFLAYRVPKKRRVLYIDGELPLDLLQSMLFEFLGKTELQELDLIPSEKVYQMLGPNMNLNNPDHQAALLRLLDELEAHGRRPELICFDNISTLFLEKEENSNTDQEAALLFFIQLRHLGYSLEIVHHAGYTGNQRGATRRMDILDLVVKLSETSRPNKNGASFKWSYEKTRYKPPSPYEFECDLVHDADGILTWKVRENTEKKEKKWIEVLRWIEKKRPEYQKDIAEAFNISSPAITQHLDKARGRGYLNGLDITDEGRAFLALKSRYETDDDA